MEKTKKSEMVTIRMSPEEKKATQNLAERLGISTADVLRLSLIHTLNDTSGAIIPELLNVKGTNGQPSI